MQRYHRLKQEVADLINDVEQVKVNNKATRIFYKFSVMNNFL